jgi:3-methyladenine DNA glycosylase AlkC
MPEALKETLFSQQVVEKFAGSIAGAHPAFDRTDFLQKVFDSSWNGLELKARMRHMTLCLKQTLPEDYRTALDILRKAAELMTTGGFVCMVFCDFAALYGLDDWDVSLPALGQFTCLCSAEYAVRPFIIQNQERMLAQMLVWAGDENVHCRRLASEGCRPRLPWGVGLPALKADPLPILPILERLKDDPEDYVRRSVANNLNDIAKDNPTIVIEVLKAWKAQGVAAFDGIANRALRTLIKSGDPAALALVDVVHGSQIEVIDLKVEPQTIPAGGEVVFSFRLHSIAPGIQNLVVDYVIHLVRANGKQSPKVFKLAKKQLSPGETVGFTKKHSFRKITTRRYYPGLHLIEIQVNGVGCGRAEFYISED